MIHSRAIRHAAAFICLGLTALPLACSSDDEEKASPSTGGTGGGGSGGAGGSGATDGGDASCTFGEPEVKACNLTANDCPCGAKCNIVRTSQSPPIFDHACVALKGAKTKGEECTREIPGIDDCGPGLVCWKNGADPVLRCRALCDKTSQCESDQFCVDLTFGQNPDKLIWGLCRAKCDPFNPAAICATGEKCDWAPTVEATVTTGCWQSMGSAPEGTPCGEDPDTCGTGLACLGMPGETDIRCRAFCDKAHPCPGGFSCIGAPGADFTLCMPAPADAGTDAAIVADTDGATDASSD